MEKENRLSTRGVIIKNGIPPERHIVTNWVEQYFNPHWASEVEQAFSLHPLSCLLAIEKDKLVGFACYDTTAPSFFGPTGVLESHRGLGIGKLLLQKSLLGLKNKGYYYGIIGGVGPVEFYRQVCGAVVIESKSKGIYSHMLR